MILSDFVLMPTKKDREGNDTYFAQVTVQRTKWWLCIPVREVHKAVIFRSAHATWWRFLETGACTPTDQVMDLERAYRATLLLSDA